LAAAAATTAAAAAAAASVGRRAEADGATPLRHDRGVVVMTENMGPGAVR